MFLNLIFLILICHRESAMFWKWQVCHRRNLKTNSNANLNGFKGRIVKKLVILRIGTNP